MTHLTDRQRELHDLYGQLPDTYPGSAVGVRITRTRMIHELKDHQVGELTEMLAEFDAAIHPGSDGLYDAAEVLAWLGY